MILRLLVLPAAIAIILASPALAVITVVDYVPAGPLLERVEAHATFADIEPLSSTVHSDAIVVHGVSGSGLEIRNYVVALERDSLAERARRAFDLSDVTVLAGAESEIVVVGIDGNGHLAIEVLDMQLRVKQRGALHSLPRLRSLAAALYGEAKLVLIVEHEEGLPATPLEFDLIRPREPKELEISASSLEIREVRALWADSSNQQLFFDVTELNAIIAMPILNDSLPIAKRPTIVYRQQAELGYNGPLAAVGVMTDRPCRAERPTSFVAYEAGLQQLVVLDYDEDFGLFSARAVANDILSRADMSVAPESNENGAAMLAQDCSQSTIIVGPSEVKGFLQFARTSPSTLDKVGVVDLPFQPTHLATDGGQAVALSRLSRDIVLLGPQSAQSAPRNAQSAETDVTRALQRLLAANGYEVGPVDGVFGQGTRVAINEFEKRSGTDIDTSMPENALRDIERALVGRPQASSSELNFASAAGPFPVMASQWPHPVIQVCWEQFDPKFQFERSLVQKAVADSWQAHSSLSFVGWGECKIDSPGIRIAVHDTAPHTKSLGRFLDGVKDGVVLNLTFEEWSPTCRSRMEYCLKTTAVHAFGHAIGFAHEQNRSDAPDECVHLIQGADPDPTIEQLKPYDPQSVMNYCNPKYANDGVLSKLDITAVQYLYGKP